MKVEKLVREFKYGAIALADPDPAQTPEEVKAFYAGIYPELNNAEIEVDRKNATRATYTFRKAVGTKGTEDCAHNWVANGGQGGAPQFRANRYMHPEPHMHVKCSGCGLRTWFTEKQWIDLPVLDGQT